MLVKSVKILLNLRMDEIDRGYDKNLDRSIFETPSVIVHII